METVVPHPSPRPTGQAVRQSLVRRELSFKDASDLICLLLLLLTFVVYLPVVWFDFVNYDDPSYVTGNPRVKTGLSVQNTLWAFTALHGEISYWHPLTWLSHQFDSHLFGARSGAHHLVNLLLHAANTLLLFLGVRRFSYSIGCGAAVAALFAVHPMHVESVAWISERKDLLSTFFFLLAIGAYFSFVERPSLKKYAIIVLLFVLALLSKPSVVTLPFALLLLDVWPLRRISLNLKMEQWRSAWLCLREKLPLFVLTAAVSVLTFVAQREVGAMQSLESLPLASRVDNALVGYYLYLQKLIWPQDLCVLYYHPGTWPGGLVLASSITLCVASIGATWLGKARPYLFVGWFWFIGTLIPLIGLVQVGIQSIADRYTYISYIGLFVLIVWAFREIFCHAVLQFFRPVFVTLSCAVIAALSIRTMQQLQHWQNSYTLFAQALKVDPNNPIARTNFAVEQQRLGNDLDAAEHYQAALKIQPGLVLPNVALGNLLVKSNRLAEAAQQFAQGIQFERARGVENAHTGLAYVFSLSGNTRKAIDHYQRALQIRPDLLVANNNLASILATHSTPELRDGARAVLLAERACRFTGYRFPFYLNTLAAAYVETGRFEEAVKTAERALALCSKSGPDTLAKEIEKRLGLYREKKPFHVDDELDSTWQRLSPAEELKEREAANLKADQPAGF